MISGVLEVDFSGEYNGMSPGDKLIFRTAVVYTFTSLDFVDYVKMTVDGNSLKMTKRTGSGKNRQRRCGAGRQYIG